MKMLLLAALATGLALAHHPANAGITCNLTDQRSNSLIYSFSRGGDDYVNEIVVKRNGAIVSNGGPMWTRVSDKAAQSMTLWQGDWSIAYPWDVTKGRSVLRAKDRVVATGVCEADYSVDAPQPAPTIEVRAPTPAPSYTAQAPSTGPDAVGIISGTRGALVQVTLGGHQEVMLIDTGASTILLSPSVAGRLVSSGEADWGGATMTEIADGSNVPARGLTIHELRIGKHVLYNVPALVNATDTMMLLGFPVLNQTGRFTIDTTSNLLVFG